MRSFHTALRGTLAGLLAAPLLFAAAGLAAARTPAPQVGPDSTAEAAEPERRPCPFRRNISGWNAVKGSRRHVVLSTGPRDFLLTLSPGCRQLHFDETIALKSTPRAGLCVTRGDVIISRFGQRCFIIDIERVEDMKEARAIVAERMKAEEEGD